MALDHFEDNQNMLREPWWNFNILLNNQPDAKRIEQMVKAYAPALDHPGLYPAVPQQWLHSTILAVGQVSDFSEQEMMAVVEVLQPKLASLDLPKFAFDSWWLFGAVVLHISPEDQFTKIYNCVTEALIDVVGPNRTRSTPHGSFLSHMSLAYTRTHNQELEINRQLADNPVKSPGFRVEHLSLIKQYPKDGHYEWSIVKELPIGTK